MKTVTYWVLAKPDIDHYTLTRCFTPGDVRYETPNAAIDSLVLWLKSDSNVFRIAPTPEIGIKHSEQRRVREVAVSCVERDSGSFEVKLDYTYDVRTSEVKRKATKTVNVDGETYTKTFDEVVSPASDWKQLLCVCESWKFFGPERTTVPVTETLSFYVHKDTSTIVEDIDVVRQDREFVIPSQE